MTAWHISVKTNIIISANRPSKAEATQQIESFIPTRPGVPMQYLGPPITREANFQIKNEDETLFLALRRWAEEGDYQIVWDAGKDFPARKTTYQASNFEEAIAMVMRDTARSSYPLHACDYSNRVVRVLHISQSCERKGS